MGTFKKRIVGVLCSIVMVCALFFAGGFQQESYAQINEHYVVKKGDTLYRIAKQYGTTVEWVKEENRLSSNQIFIGQSLVVPSVNHPKEFHLIMAGSYKNKASAEKRVELLKQHAIDAVLVNKVINNQRYYRVQAGVFSKKENAEKVRRRVIGVGVNDAYILTAKPLQINGVSLGSDYNHLINQFGNPLFYEEKSNLQALYYMHEGAGVRVKYTMDEGRINQLQVYSEYLKNDTVPRNREGIYDEYGYPNEVKDRTCYESASCEQFVYRFRGEQLIVQFDRDGKTVQYLELR